MFTGLRSEKEEEAKNALDDVSFASSFDDESDLEGESANETDEEDSLLILTLYENLKVNGAQFPSRLPVLFLKSKRRKLHRASPKNSPKRVPICPFSAYYFTRSKRALCE